MNVNSVNEAVELTTAQVHLAYAQKTFAVGGILMDIAGNVIHAMHNDVVEDGLVKDPTAHGERQLIDWYFENRDSKGLPSPDKMVLVTSLDPCAMCTGAILSSGFHLVIVSAPDKFAGINYNLQANFPTLYGTGSEARADRTLAYPEIKGNAPSPSFDRPASGAKITIFPEDSQYIEAIVAKTNELLFTTTVQSVSDTINSDSTSEDDLKNLALEAPSNWIYQEVTSRYSDAFLYKSPRPGRPDRGLAPYLKYAAIQDRKNGGSGDAVAFLDYFGNLLFCTYGQQNVSPIRTAFMRATRLYAELRYVVAKRGGNEALKYLCHPKYGTFVLTYQPSAQEAKTLMDLGAYGSTMEGKIPNTNQLQYVLSRSSSPISTNQLISQMPPFYTEVVNIRMSQVIDIGLINDFIGFNP